MRTEKYAEQFFVMLYQIIDWRKPLNKYFFNNKKKLIIYMLLSPAMAITSVLFSLSLEPLITVSTQ